MLKRFQRIAATKSAVRVSVRILSLQFLHRETITAGSLLSVVYENRGKLKSTAFKPVQDDNESSFVTIEEYLDFSASIYISPSGKPMRKSRELSIRMQDSKKANVSAEVGKVEMNLNDIPEATPTRFSLNVSQNGKPMNATLEVVITITSQDEEYIPDDMSSIASDMSYSRQISHPGSSSPPRLKSIQFDASRQPESKDFEDHHGISQISMDLEKAIVDKENAEALYQECLKEVSQLKKTVAEFSLVAEELSREKATLEAEKGALRSEFQEQVGKFYTQIQEKEMLEIKLQELKSTLDDVESSTSSSNMLMVSELAAVKKEAASLRQSNSELEGLAEQLQARVSDLEATIFSRQESESEMRRHIQQLKSRIASAEVNEAAGYELVASLKAKVTDCEVEIKGLMAEKNNLQQQIDERVAHEATMSAAAAVDAGSAPAASFSGAEPGHKNTEEEKGGAARTPEDIKLQSTITEANSRLEIMISQIDQYSRKAADPGRRKSEIDPLVELARDMGSPSAEGVSPESTALKCELQTAQSALAAVGALVDEERQKNRALKTCMIRFASGLTPDEVDMLFDAGIVLSMQK